MLSPTEAAAPAATFEDLVRSLAGKDPNALASRDRTRLARALAELRSRGAAPHVTVAYLSNFTLDPLAACVEVRCAFEGLFAASYTGRYGQYVQEVLEDGGALAAARPDLVFLALSLRQLRPERAAALGTLSAAGRRELRREVIEHVAGWVALARERLPGAALLVANFVASARPAAGVADANLAYGEAELYLELNLELLRRFKGDPRVRLFDLDSLAARFGKDRVTDRKLLYLAKMAWSPAFLPAVAEEVLRHVKAVRGLAKKCLVLDLDNTLWGGVVGEEGAGGVRIGPGDPEGEAFLDFQHRLKELQGRGVLLAVASKNNPADALEVFATRPEVPLKSDDFAALEISWDPKHESLRRIARDLDVGLDSLVFLDDNPAEIELIRQMLPEVEAHCLPPDPAEYAAFLDRLTCFEKAAVLEEDLRKTAQYRENRERRDRERAAGGDLEGYLASLGTEVALRRAGRADLARAHQLFAKTNQFNLTTVRYSLTDLERLAADPGWHLGVAAARDRFGDLGTIAAYLLRLDGERLVIDSFLMSCRAMGRGIESAVMNHVKELFAADGHRELVGRYRPTPKNQPAESFYAREGLRLMATSDEGEKLYVLTRAEARPTSCPWIAVRVAG